MKKQSKNQILAAYFQYIQKKQLIKDASIIFQLHDQTMPQYLAVLDPSIFKQTFLQFLNIALNSHSQLAQHQGDFTVYVDQRCMILWHQKQKKYFGTSTIVQSQLYFTSDTQNQQDALQLLVDRNLIAYHMVGEPIYQVNQNKFLIILNQLLQNYSRFVLNKKFTCIQQTQFHQLSYFIVIVIKFLKLRKRNCLEQLFKEYMLNPKKRKSFFQSNVVEFQKKTDFRKQQDLLSEKLNQVRRQVQKKYTQQIQQLKNKGRIQKLRNAQLQQRLKQLQQININQDSQILHLKEQLQKEIIQKNELIERRQNQQRQSLLFSRTISHKHQTAIQNLTRELQRLKEQRQGSQRRISELQAQLFSLKNKQQQVSLTNEQLKIQNQKLYKSYVQIDKISKSQHNQLRKMKLFQKVAGEQTNLSTIIRLMDQEYNRLIDKLKMAIKKKSIQI